MTNYTTTTLAPAMAEAEEYCETAHSYIARKLEADEILTPDDYMYLIEAQAKWKIVTLWKQSVQRYAVSFGVLAHGMALRDLEKLATIHPSAALELIEDSGIRRLLRDALDEVYAHFLEGEAL